MNSSGILGVVTPDCESVPQSMEGELRRLRRIGRAGFGIKARGFDHSARPKHCQPERPVNRVVANGSASIVLCRHAVHEQSLGIVNTCIRKPGYGFHSFRINVCPKFSDQPIRHLDLPCAEAFGLGDWQQAGSMLDCVIWVEVQYLK
jgi:hypothetical protein